MRTRRARRTKSASAMSRCVRRKPCSLAECTVRGEMLSGGELGAVARGPHLLRSQVRGPTPQVCGLEPNRRFAVGPRSTDLGPFQQLCDLQKLYGECPPPRTATRTPNRRNCHPPGDASRPCIMQVTNPLAPTLSPRLHVLLFPPHPPPFFQLFLSTKACNYFFFFFAGPAYGVPALRFPLLAAYRNPQNSVPYLVYFRCQTQTL